MEACGPLHRTLQGAHPCQPRIGFPHELQCPRQNYVPVLACHGLPGRAVQDTETPAAERYCKISGRERTETETQSTSKKIECFTCGTTPSLRNKLERM